LGCSQCSFLAPFRSFFPPFFFFLSDSAYLSRKAPILLLFPDRDALVAGLPPPSPLARGCCFTELPPTIFFFVSPPPFPVLLAHSPVFVSSPPPSLPRSWFRKRRNRSQHCRFLPFFSGWLNFGTSAVLLTLVLISSRAPFFPFLRRGFSNTETATGSGVFFSFSF